MALLILYHIAMSLWNLASIASIKRAQDPSVRIIKIKYNLRDFLGQLMGPSNAVITL